MLSAAKTNARIALLLAGTLIALIGGMGAAYAACETKDYIGDSFKGGRISSGFGSRPAPVDPRTGARGSTFHRAIDWVPSNIGNVGALYGGTVTFSGPRSGWGNTVIVTNGNFQVQYAHAGNLNVSPGQTIAPGQSLGDWSSCSGTCSGPHVDLIYRVNVNGQWQNVDPVIAERLIASGLAPGSDEFNKKALEETEARCGAGATRGSNPPTGGGPMCSPKVMQNLQAQVDAARAKRTDFMTTLMGAPVTPQHVSNTPCKSRELQRISNQFAYAPSMYAADALGQLGGLLGPVSGIVNNFLGADMQALMKGSQSLGGLAGAAFQNFAQGALNSMMSQLGLGDTPFAAALCGIMVDTLLNYIQCESPFKLPPLGKLTGSLNNMLPKGCAGEAVRGALYRTASESALKPATPGLLFGPKGYFSPSAKPTYGTWDPTVTPP